MNIADYTNNPDRLLTEIGFTGAQYGLYMPVMAIATHLGKVDKTRAPSVLMLGLLNISMKNYTGARTILQAVADTKEYSAFATDALAMLAILNQIDPVKS